VQTVILTIVYGLDAAVRDRLGSKLSSSVDQNLQIENAKSFGTEGAVNCRLAVLHRGLRLILTKERTVIGVYN
jgi:hypothetical protein